MILYILIYFIIGALLTLCYFLYKRTRLNKLDINDRYREENCMLDTMVIIFFFYPFFFILIGTVWFFDVLYIHVIKKILKE